MQDLYLAACLLAVFDWQELGVLSVLDRKPGMRKGCDTLLCKSHLLCARRGKGEGHTNKVKPMVCFDREEEADWVTRSIFIITFRLVLAAKKLPVISEDILLEQTV